MKTRAPGSLAAAPRRPVLTAGAILLAGVILLAGCGDDPNDGIINPNPHRPIEIPGVHLRSFAVDGWIRSYRVYVPETVDLDEPNPVIMALHGFPWVDMAEVTGLNELAEEMGFLAVYPNAWRNLDWAHACDRCSPSAFNGIDDLKFFREMLDKLEREAEIDEERVYVTGFSAGGIMTYRLACALSGRIAGASPVASGMWEWHADRCQQGRQVPILIFGATDDGQFPFEGSDQIPIFEGTATQLPVLDIVDFWSEKNGCADAVEQEAVPDAHDDGTTVERWEPAGCDAETVFYLIRDGGHQWPGGPVEFQTLGRRTREVDASRLVAEFFLRQSR